MKIQDKVAIVTGGAQGLGRGFAEGLLQNGASVVICDVNTYVGIQTESELNKKYGPKRCTFLKCDVTQHEDLKYVFSKTIELYGNIDIVVNNAGIGDNENKRLVVDINLIAVIESSYLALDYMGKDKGGRGGLIVNISSAAGIWETPPGPVYAASKHGVVGLSRALGARQEDVVRQGVRVCCLCPTFVRTALTVNVPSDVAKVIKQMGMLEVPEVVDAFIKIVDDDSLHAAVVLVSPHLGVVVQYPDKLKGSKL